jgi:branched-chain amino acid transport system substrate-binding protein
VFPIVQRPEAGRDRRDAFLIAIYEINNQTGVDRILPAGVTLSPQVEADDDSAAGGQATAQNLINWGVDIVIGPSASSASAAMATELTPYKIPQISYASTLPILSNRTDYPYFMRVVPSEADQSKALADLVSAFNWTEGATIHTSQFPTASRVQEFTKIFESRGGTVLTNQNFPTGTNDVSSSISAIKTVAPDFILGSFSDADAASVMAEASLQGADTIPWIMTDRWSRTSTFTGDSTVEAAMQKVIGTSRAPLQGQGYQTFNDTWFDPAWNWLESPNNSQVNKTGFDPYAPFAYDAVYVAAKGLAAAETTAGDPLLSALYNVTHEGASGSIEFNLQGEVHGQYDYVQLRDATFHLFGKWLGTSSFDTGTITLRDGSNWILSGSLSGPSPPTIITPNGGETLQGVTLVNWKTSLNPLGVTVNYSVHYSSDNGATWTNLADGLTTASYNWNTTTVPNGFSYRIKVLALNSEGNTAEDISDDAFTIQNPTPTTISLTPGWSVIVITASLVIPVLVKNSRKTDKR